jgi:hypothetical protein
MTMKEYEQPTPNLRVKTTEWKTQKWRCLGRRREAPVF